jgi:olefin beta-lactone synthetase
MIDLYHAFNSKVTATPNQTAIIDKKYLQALSYTTLDHYVHSVEQQLETLNLEYGDKVLVLEPMGYKLYSILISCFKMGLCAVFVDPSQNAHFINQACDIAKPKAFIASPKAMLLMLKATKLFSIPIKLTTQKIPFFKALYFKEVSVLTTTEILASNTPALMTFTSGSTGRPKAIVRTHQFLLNQYRVLHPHIHLKDGSIELSTLPIFVLANLFSGVCSVIADTSLHHPKKIDITIIEETIAQNGVTRIAASPALFEHFTKAHHFKNVTAIYLGGAPVLPTLLFRLRTVFPNATINTLYGSSEAEPISTFELPQLNEDIYQKMLQGKGLFVGDVVKEIAIKIINDEIVVHGNHVVQSYHDKEDNKENKIKIEGEIWHKTGDAGYFDENNKLWLLGRISAKISYKSEHGSDEPLYPFSIEVATREITKKMSVLTLYQEVPTLFIEAKEHEHEALTTLLKKTIMILFPILSVRFISSIPLDKRHNAKVDYPELKKVLQNSMN